jgi:sugar-specific transcriptional regulator TrmB
MFEFNDRRIQNLIKFGLTFSQATVYLTLLKLGESSVKRIAENSNIARSEVYRIIVTLEKMGLAERIIAVPTRYKATPVRVGYKELFQNKINQYTRLREEAWELIKKTEEGDDEMSSTEDDQNLILISSKIIHEKKVDLEDKEAKSSIDIIGDLKGLKIKEFYQAKIHEQALKRGVNIRIIAEKLEPEQPGKFSPLEDGLSFQVRYIPSPLSIKMAIYDKKKVNLSVGRTSGEGIVPALWSSNPVLVKIIVAYFEELWEHPEQLSGENKSEKKITREMRKMGLKNQPQGKHGQSFVTV